MCFLVGLLEGIISHLLLVGCLCGVFTPTASPRDLPLLAFLPFLFSFGGEQRLFA